MEEAARGSDVRRVCILKMSRREVFTRDQMISGGSLEDILNGGGGQGGRGVLLSMEDLESVKRVPKVSRSRRAQTGKWSKLHA